LNELGRFRMETPAIQFNAKRGEKSTDDKIVGTRFFKLNFEIDGTFRRGGLDEDEESALKVDLAGEVVGGNLLEILTFLRGKEAGVERGRTVRHFN